MGWRWPWRLRRPSLHASTVAAWAAARGRHSASAIVRMRRILPDMSTTDDERLEAAKRRLRAALDGVELLPEETTDERLIRASEAASRENDEELRRNVPPHHGG